MIFAASLQSVRVRKDDRHATRQLFDHLDPSLKPGADGMTGGVILGSPSTTFSRSSRRHKPVITGAGPSFEPLKYFHRFAHSSGLAGLEQILQNTAHQMTITAVRNPAERTWTPMLSIILRQFTCS